MTRQEFIFSDHRQHQFSRHVIFWVIWWLAYALLFHIPLMELKGWGLSREAAPATFRDVEKIGWVLYAIKTLTFNCLLSILIPQAILTYTVLYWILPNYFYRKQNILITVAVLIIISIAYFLVATQFRWFAVMGNQVFGLQPRTITWYDFTLSVSRSVLRLELNSLPVLIGTAVMIRLIKRWWLKQQETEQVAREKTKAELQLLKAQVHPHFLFNTLNNIYFFSLSRSPKAPEMITKLSGLLHYILNECSQTLVSFDKEIKMIQDYLSLEKIRYGDDMNMSVELPSNPTNVMIAPLLLIPFIENSFKHGASKMLSHPYVSIRITVENNILHFFISNSRPHEEDSIGAKTYMPNSPELRALKQGNIGLKNVRKRLELLYPSDHELNIIEEPGSFTVYLKIKLAKITVPSERDESIKPVQEYAVA